MHSFEQILVKQIVVLSEILMSSSLLHKEYVLKNYLNYERNFEETVEFLSSLGCINIVNSEMHILPWYKSYLNKNKDNLIDAIKRLIISKLLLESRDMPLQIDNFLSLFQKTNGRYEFIPTSAQQLSYSEVRNFLIEFDFLSVDQDRIKYVINDEYAHLLIKRANAIQIAPEELARALEKHRQLGANAEIQVVAYERNRLQAFPELPSRIDHVALRDTALGYDIKSFEVPPHDNHYSERFIEVKAVSPLDYTFYLTRNELQKSSELGARYYLYLLPVLSDKKFDFDRMIIVQDPYANVAMNHKQWSRVEELLSFSKMI
jgi:hypothetical protein